MNNREYTRLAPLFQDSRLQAAFRRIENDGSAALVLPRQPEPVLIGGAAVRVEEFA